MTTLEFLQPSQEGQNAFWRYLLTTLAMVWIAFGVQLLAILPAFVIEGTTDITQFSTITLLVVAMIPFPFVIATLWGGLRVLHQRPFQSLLRPGGGFSWAKLLLSGGLWLGFMGAADVISAALNPGNYEWTFDPLRSLPYFALALVLIPIQTSAEELIFRGYLTQWMGRYSKKIWLPLLVPSAVFMLLHGLNPEVESYGFWLTMPFYFAIGLLLGWITLRSGGLELALGLHAANNLYAAILVTFPDSAIPSPAFFTMREYDPVLGLIVFAAAAVAYLGMLFVIRRKWLARAGAVAGLAIVLGAALASPAQAQTRSYQAERFDVEIEVLADGSLYVTETVVFDFSGGPFTYAFRQLTLNELDRVQIVGAAMDGQALDRGDQAGQVEILEGNDPIEVTWHFPPTSDTRRTFVLEYQVFGNIRQDGDYDRLAWQAIPEDHEYEIRSSSITVTYPPGIEAVELPGLRNNPTTGTAEAGGVVFRLNDLARDQAVVVDARFPGGSLISEPPAWQAIDLERRRQLQAGWPYAVGAGLVVIAGSLAGLVGLKRKFEPKYEDTIQPGEVTNPPDELSPGLAAFLAEDGRGSVVQVFATLIELARRGWVSLEPVEATGLFKAKDYRIRRLRDASALQPHEAFIYQVVFHGRAEESGETLLSKAAQQIGSKINTYTLRAREELEADGSILAKSFKQRESLNAGGIITFFSGMILGILGAILIGRVGESSTLIGIILVGGALGLVAGAAIAWLVGSSWGILSAQGKQRQMRWIAFRNYLRRLSKPGTTLQGSWLEEYLPYAVAFNMGDRWVKAFRDQGLSTVLSWTGAGGAAIDSNVLTAVIISSSASSGSSGGAGGGGGGSSGAG